MTRILFGHPPMYNVPLPPVTLAGGAAPRARVPNEMQNATCRMFFMDASAGEDQIELAPVLLCRRALGRPVGRVIELVGYLRRPEAADVAVEDIALDRLAQARRAARRIGLPPWREDQRTAEREMRLRRLLRRGPLEGGDGLLRSPLSAFRCHLTRASLQLVFLAPLV